jgi:hypothetical protein
MNNIDGMSSWTFQNTQNARGLPRGTDGFGNDIYLAYPDANGPIATLKWEAIREGIDDHKLLYQLVKRIKRLEEKGFDASKYKEFLLGIGKKEGTPDCQEGFDDKWDPRFFEKSRDRLISMILDAEAKIN